MDFQFYLYIAISAGTGTAVVEILLKLFLSHLLDRQFYKFKLQTADRRTCAEEILDLINSKHGQRWADLSDDIYYKAYAISDRLLTLNEADYSKKLDKYTSAKRFSNDLIKRILDNPTRDEYTKSFLDSQNEVDE